MVRNAARPGETQAWLKLGCPSLQQPKSTTRFLSQAFAKLRLCDTVLRCPANLLCFLFGLACVPGVVRSVGRPCGFQSAFLKSATMRFTCASWLWGSTVEHVTIKIFLPFLANRADVDCTYTEQDTQLLSKPNSTVTPCSLGSGHQAPSRPS